MKPCSGDEATDGMPRFMADYARRDEIPVPLSDQGKTARAEPSSAPLKEQRQQAGDTKKLKQLPEEAAGDSA